MSSPPLHGADQNKEELELKVSPPRQSKSDNTLTPSRNAISLYDSDSSDEFQRHHCHKSEPTLFLAATSTDDIDVPDDASVEVGQHEDDVVIILSDEEDVNDDDEQARPSLQIVSSFDNSTDDVLQLHEEKGRLAAMGVEDKPWRKDGKDTRLVVPSTAFASVDDDDDVVSLTPTPSGSLGKEDESTDSEDGFEEHDEEMHDDDSSTMISTLSLLSDVVLDEDQVDFGKDHFPVVPNSFLGTGKLHPSMNSYLDDPLVTKGITKKEANRFVTEHSLFLRAILQLLWEKDKIADGRILSTVTSTDEADEPTNLMKKGSLKKFSHTSVGRPTWKVKYVEVRRGNGGSIRYYEDDVGDSNLFKLNRAGRKTIPLHNCSVKEVVVKGASGCVLEISGPQQPRRLFMANSEEERQSWMRSIQEAMQSDHGEKQVPIELEPYQLAIDQYQTLQANLLQSLSREEYMQQWKHILAVTATEMTLPSHWKPHDPSIIRRRHRQRHRNHPSMTDFYKFLTNTTVLLNGHEIPAGSSHNAERAIGALSRGILEYDKSSLEEHAQQQDNITDLQSISFARDVLISVWKARTKDESHRLLDGVTRNTDLVKYVLNEQGPVTIHLAYTTVNDLVPSSDEDQRNAEISGWVGIRSKSFKNWKSRFMVISDGVLSYYEHATPRPHGLRGQLVLVGATLMTVDDEADLYVLQIVTQDRERFLSFRDEASFVEWKSALQTAIEVCSQQIQAPASPPRGQTSQQIEQVSPEELKSVNPKPKSSTRMKLLTPSGRAKMPTGRIIKGATEGGYKAIKGGAERAEQLFRGLGVKAKGLHNRANSSGIPSGMEQQQRQHEALLIKQEPTVQIVVNACSYYKVLSAKDVTPASEEAWLTVCSKTSKTFQVCGGPSGKLTTIHDVITLFFREGLASAADFDEVVDK